jgi:hypothetical protein
MAVRFGAGKVTMRMNRSICAGRRGRRQAQSKDRSLQWRGRMLENAVLGVHAQPGAVATAGGELFIESDA